LFKVKVYIVLYCIFGDELIQDKKNERRPKD